MARAGGAVTPQAKAALLIAEHRMLRPGERVLAACSGGADSTALAIVLRDLGYRPLVGHVDHGMRAGSALDAEHTCRTAAALGLPVSVVRVEVSPRTQAAARGRRYEVLEEMARREGIRCIATGHTLDDQAETVRMRLERGGYGMGIPPVRGCVVRPLLQMRRSETEQICREAGVEYCIDPSNSNLAYRRVRVRGALAAAPDGETARLARLAETTRLEAQSVERDAEKLFRTAEVSRHGTSVARADLAGAPEPIRRQFLHRLGLELGLELKRRTVGDVLAKVAGHTGSRLALPGGLWAWSDRDRVWIGTPPAAGPMGEHRVREDGITDLPPWGLRIEAASVPPGPGAYDSDPATEVIDADRLVRPLFVRSWKPGDRFRPLGGTGSRKLQDFFVDAGVPREVRHRVPLIVSGEDIVWVAGHRLDHRFRVRPGSRRLLRLRLWSAGEAVERLGRPGQDLSDHEEGAA